MNRWNLQAIDRIALIAKQETLKASIKQKAKENQQARKGNQAGATCKKSDKLPIDTKKELAKAAGVSHDTYRKGVVILEKAATALCQDRTAALIPIEPADSLSINFSNKILGLTASAILVIMINDT